MFVLFGAGLYGRDALDIIGKDRVAYFLDNDSNKIGSCINDKKIFGLEEKLSEIKNHRVVITVCKRNEPALRHQLIEHGINEFMSINEQFYSGLNEYNRAVTSYQNLIPCDAQGFYGGDCPKTLSDMSR